jgi:hypothetical protein
MSKIRSSFALLAGCAVALGFGGGTAFAADMGLPTKGPAPMAAPAAAPPLDIHGFSEFLWGSTYINPQGQMLGTHGEESAVAGLNWTVWHGNGFIDSATLGGLVAIDFAPPNQPGAWSGFAPTMYGDLFDLVLAASGSVTFLKYWTLRDQFTWVINEHVAGIGSTVAANCFNPGSGGCAASTWMPQNDLRLTLNDSFTGWWITWNPYVDWAYVLPSGQNSASGTNAETQPCFTCGPNRSDFFVGIDPTVGLQKWWGIPLTLKAPTYITVGPENFWQGGFGFPTGTTNAGGTVGNHGIWGVFTTGLTAIYSLQNWVPKNYGNWYVRGGFQYYNLINENLRVSEQASIGQNHQNIWVGFAGIGVTF